MTGFGRKPEWVDERTPKVAALNVWKAKQQYTEQTGRTTLTERRSRKSAMEWKLNLQGHKSKLDEAPNMRKLAASIKKRRKEAQAEMENRGRVEEKQS